MYYKSNHEIYILLWLDFSAEHIFEIHSHFLYISSPLYWRRQWHPAPVLLPGKSFEQRSLVGCSPWVAKSRTRLSDFTFTFPFHALEKETATPSSVLAWRIPGRAEPGGLPVYGIAQSRTRLKWLSSPLYC